MRKVWITAAALFLACNLAAAAHMKKEDLPAGPIRDRHELMEGIGKNAKIIGDALKAGNTAPVAGAAEKLQGDAAKITALFPPGSTHAKSRAKPEIWQNWPKFEEGTKELQANAGRLAAAARSGGDVRAAAKAMFGACKSCHDQFRVPEKKKG
ncbi:MAG: c-type cytochrome [Candidatus Binatia bacterium]